MEEVTAFGYFVNKQQYPYNVAANITRPMGAVLAACALRYLVNDNIIIGVCCMNEGICFCLSLLFPTRNEF